MLETINVNARANSCPQGILPLQTINTEVKVKIVSPIIEEPMLLSQKNLPCNNTFQRLMQ